MLGAIKRSKKFLVVYFFVVCTILKRNTQQLCVGNPYCNFRILIRISREISITKFKIILKKLAWKLHIVFFLEYNFKKPYHRVSVVSVVFPAVRPALPCCVCWINKFVGHTKTFRFNFFREIFCIRIWGGGMRVRGQQAVNYSVHCTLLKGNFRCVFATCIWK